MFEINPSRKITKSEEVKSDNKNTQQRAFLNEAQDTLDLSYKKKKNVSFGAAIHDAVTSFLSRDNSPISPKAVAILKKNNIDFQTETSIVTDLKNITSMPAVFQKKLAIDLLEAKPDTTENVYNSNQLKAKIIYNSDGKPSEIQHYELGKLTTSEQFEYAKKQDGTSVLTKETIFKHNENDKVFDNSITFYKHHNGAVTISSTDGREMSYSLRKETIRDYNNTPTVVTQPVQQKPATINQQTTTPESLFVKPTPQYPQREYTNGQKYTINSKLDTIKREFEKWHNPNDEYAYASVEPVLKELEKTRQLILDSKDPVIQDTILKLISETKDSDLPTSYVGSYNHIDVYNDYSNFIKIYKLAKISALTNGELLKLNPDNKLVNNLEEKFIRTYNDTENSFSYEDIRAAEENIEAVMLDEAISETERKAKTQEIIHKLEYNKLAENISTLSYKFPELKEHLANTYIKQNIPEEYREDLNNIEKSTGEIIIPQNHSNFTYDNLKNFHKLNETAKAHFLKHPNMCENIYLYNNTHFMVETPYEALANLSEDEWNTFEKRNIGDILDIVTGFNVSSFKEKTGKNIHKVIEMSDNDWEKLNDFGLLKHGIKGDELYFEKHRNLTFDFDEMQSILDNLSYRDWETAQKRGLDKMTSDNVTDYNNYGRNIGVPILISAAKIPDSTFRFLNNIGLFKDNKVNLRSNSNESLEDVAKGIEFLSKSHSDVYDNVSTLINNGFSPEVSLELVGIGAKNYNRFGKYLTGKTLELKNKGLNERDIVKVLPMYVDLQTIKGKSDINELSIEEKRTLVKNIIKYNSQFFEPKYANLLDSPIAPKNKEEYCAILPKLIKSIGIDVRPVTQEVIDNFETAINSMADENSEFLNTKFTKDGFKLELEYPRKEFISDIEEKVANLSDTEKMKVYDYFGFDLKSDKNNIIQMHGYPINVNNGAKLSAIENEETRNIVEEVRPLVEKFSHNNKVSINGKPELTKQINDILELFPEFRSIIGKEQHGTHDFSVDVHTLKVLQGVMSDKKYSTLPEKDKKLLSIATLLHDLTKAENTVDKTHPSYSAYDTYHIVSKMDMDDNDRLKIYQIIKNHDWLEQYNGKVRISTDKFREKTPQEKEKVAKDIAFELKDGNNFELASILTKSDMKAVKETDEFFNRFETAFYEATSKIKPLIDNIQQTAIHLPQTKIPKSSELKVDGKNVIEYTYKNNNGKELKYKMVKLQPDMDLGVFGFEQGLNSNDLNVIVHALEQDTQSATFQALGSVDSDSLLSSSYVNYAKGNYHVFRQQGFILDVDSSDIQAGTYKDFGSGYGKDLETLKSEYLFNGKRDEIRKFMSDNIKKRLQISDKEYQNLYPEISNKSITELDKTHPQVAKAMREMFMDMKVHMRKYGRDYNEWLISRPKIQGVFIQGSKYNYNDPPEYLIQYAMDNDLPIIYFGE